MRWSQRGRAPFVCREVTPRFTFSGRVAQLECVRPHGRFMRYVDFRNAIQEELLRHPDGRTWAELRDHLDLPYDRPCPSWTACLEREIGLLRVKGPGRSLLWKLGGHRDKNERAA